MDIQDKSNKWLKKAIIQHKKVVNAFQYPYFWADVKEFENFKKDVLFKLIDQQKLMEAELQSRRGRL